jgi:hypothetical protein
MANNKIDNSKDPNMVMVYEDGKGNKWFSHVNVLEISPARGVSASKADRFVSLRITEDNLKTLLDKAIDGVNKKQDFVQMASIVSEIRIRLELMSERTSLLDLAAIYYFLEDEDPVFPSNHHDKLKREIWKDDAQCASFFLHMSLALTKQFSTTSEEDLLKYLANLDVQEISDRIHRFIPD